LIPADLKALDGNAIRRLNFLIEEKLLIKEQEQLNFWIEEVENALKSDLQGTRNNIKLLLEKMKNRHKIIFSERREVVRNV